jgi:hypothetical protein
MCALQRGRRCHSWRLTGTTPVTNDWERNKPPADDPGASPDRSQQIIDRASQPES